MDLGDVMKYLVLLLYNKKIDLGFHQRADWHNAFYRLTQPPLSLKVPASLRLPELFEWNGPYPTHSEIDDTIGAFCLSRCVTCESPKFTGYRLDEGVAKIWQEEYHHLPNEERDFLENVALGRLLEEFENVDGALPTVASGRGVKMATAS